MYRPKTLQNDSKIQNQTGKTFFLDPNMFFSARLKSKTTITKLSSLNKTY